MSFLIKGLDPASGVFLFELQNFKKQQKNMTRPSSIDRLLNKLIIYIQT